MDGLRPRCASRVCLPKTAPRTGFDGQATANRRSASPGWPRSRPCESWSNRRRDPSQWTQPTIAWKKSGCGKFRADQLTRREGSIVVGKCSVRAPLSCGRKSTERVPFGLSSYSRGFRASGWPYALQAILKAPPPVSSDATRRPESVCGSTARKMISEFGALGQEEAGIRFRPKSDATNSGTPPTAIVGEMLDRDRPDADRTDGSLPGTWHHPRRVSR